MNIWKNTTTLDPYTSALHQTTSPEIAELAVIGSKPFDLRTMPCLKGVFKCGVGMDNVSADELERQGIRLGMPSEETKRFIYEETANFAVYLIFRLLYADVGDVGQWRKARRSFLGNRAVLVIGTGNIGAHVVKKLRSSCRVLTYDAASDEPEILLQLLPQADVVSLHLPLNEDTRGIFDATMLARMKDGAGLVNTARGPLVDEEALYTELQRGRLRAAFDTFWHEPYRGKLANFDSERFLMSPHVASANEDFLCYLARDFERFQAELAGIKPE